MYLSIGPYSTGCMWKVGWHAPSSAQAHEGSCEEAEKQRADPQHQTQAHSLPLMPCADCRWTGREPSGDQFLLDDANLPLCSCAEAGLHTFSYPITMVVRLWQKQQSKLALYCSWNELSFKSVSCYNRSHCLLCSRREPHTLGFVLYLHSRNWYGVWDTSRHVLRHFIRHFVLSFFYLL